MKRIFTIALLASGLAVAGCSQAHFAPRPGPGKSKISSSPASTVPGWMTSVGPSASVPGVPATRTPVAVACHPRTPSGGCYEPGQQCPKRDYGLTGLAGDGQKISCRTGTGTEPAGVWVWTAIR